VLEMCGDGSTTADRSGGGCAHDFLRGLSYPLSLVGAHHLRDTNQGDLLGALGSMFADCERLDVHVCPRCGRVELFVEGLSRQLRQEPDAQGRSRPASAGSRSAVGLLFQEAWRLDQQEQFEVAIPRYEEVMERYPAPTLPATPNAGSRRSS
jgi:hypothetical protein